MALRVTVQLIAGLFALLSDIYDLEAQPNEPRQEKTDLLRGTREEKDETISKERRVFGGKKPQAFEGNFHVVCDVPVKTPYYDRPGGWVCLFSGGAHVWRSRTPLVLGVN